MGNRLKDKANEIFKRDIWTGSGPIMLMQHSKCLTS